MDNNQSRVQFLVRFNEWLELVCAVLGLFLCVVAIDQYEIAAIAGGIFFAGWFMDVRERALNREEGRRS